MNGGPRVLMFVPQYPRPVAGGLEKQAHELARGLLALGCHVEALSGRIFSGQSRDERVDGIRVRRIAWPANKLLRALWVPFGIAVTWGRIKGGVDIVHVHQHSWVGLYMIALAKISGKPVLAKLPSHGVFGLAGMRALFLGKFRVRLFLSSDAVVTMSPESRDELSRTGYPLGRALAVNNGIDLAGFPTHAGTEEPTAPVRVIFVGRLSEEKCLDVLLRAWDRVRNDAEFPVALEVVGEGPLQQELEALRAELSLGDDVRFCGRASDVPVRLARADVFVLPSRIEGNSNAVLEAMAAGLPIVSTPVGGTPLQVGERGRPFLVPVGDAAALAEALLRLIRDRDLRRSVGSAMRGRAEIEFDILRVAAKYLKAYRLLQAGRGMEMASVSGLAGERG